MGAFYALLTPHTSAGYIDELVKAGKSDVLKGAADAIEILIKLRELAGTSAPITLADIRLLHGDILDRAVQAKRISRKKIIQLLQVAIGETIQHMQDSGRRKSPEEFKRFGQDEIKAAVILRYRALEPFVGGRATWGKYLREAGFPEISRGSGPRVPDEKL